MNRSKRYSPEIRERAVRMVFAAWFPASTGKTDGGLPVSLKPSDYSSAFRLNKPARNDSLSVAATDFLDNPAVPYTDRIHPEAGTSRMLSTNL